MRVCLILSNPGVAHSVTLHSSRMQSNVMGHALVDRDIRMEK